MLDADELVEVLHRRGLRATPQRRAIVEVVRRVGGHVDAETVFEQVRTAMPTISLKTVYETLHSLVAIGEMRELTLGGGPTLFDTRGRPHQHLVCLTCNHIEDIDVEVEAFTAGQREGFSIVRTDVTAWGHCPACVDAGGKPAMSRPGPAPGRTIA